MIMKPWHKISAGDIQRLVEDKIPESHTLDYKQALPDESPKSELDFLFDVAALANASGGDLIFGVKEKREEGKPTATPEGFLKLRMRGTLDEAKRRLESLIRSNISPVLSININHFDGLPEGPVIVVRVPKSWAAPHMVTAYSKDYLRPQFYMRHNGGNHPMDVHEIRAAFALSETRVEKLRLFRQQRLDAAIRPHDLAITLSARGARLITHLLPVNSVDPATIIDISTLAKRKWEASSLAYGDDRDRDQHFNFEGFIIEKFKAISNHGEYERIKYAQVFRNGAIESGIALTDYARIDNDFEVNRVKQIRDLLNLQRELDISPPIFIMLTLLGVKDYPLILPPRANYKGSPRDIDRNIIALPEVVMDDFDVPVQDVLRPAFNALYQAAGMPRSFNYDEHGTWIGEPLDS